MNDDQPVVQPVRQGRFFNDLQVGDRFRSDGRTITEADIVLFAGLTGAQNPQFLDEEYARTSPLGSRVAPGPLGLSIGLALTEPLLAGTLVALLGIDNVRYHRPIRPGDTIRNEFEVVGGRLTGGGNRGIVQFQDRVLNQRGEPVVTFEHQLMLRTRSVP